MGCTASVPAHERSARSTHRRHTGKDKKPLDDETRRNTTTTGATECVAWGEGATPRGARYQRLSLDDRCCSGAESLVFLEHSYLTVPRQTTQPTFNASTPGLGSSGSISTCPTIVHPLCLAPGCVPTDGPQKTAYDSLHRNDSSFAACYPPALIRSFAQRWNHDPSGQDGDQEGNNLGERAEDLTWERLSDGTSSAGSTANESSPFIANVKQTLRFAVARAKASGHEHAFEEGPMAAVLVRTRSTVSPDVSKELDIQKLKWCEHSLSNRVAAWRYQVQSFAHERDELCADL